MSSTPCMCAALFATSEYRLVGAMFGLLLFLSGAPAAAAQETVPARNAVYVELLGNGLLYSLNYDRHFTSHISGRLGIMYAPVESEGSFSDNPQDAETRSSGTTWLTPVMVSYLSGEGNSRFEAGVGMVLGSETLGTFTLGYRYQRHDGRFLFRAGLTPVFSFSGILPWFGISFGRSF